MSTYTPPPTPPASSTNGVVFDARALGGLRLDAKLVSDAAITAGQNTATSATATWRAGQRVVITGAGAAGGQLTATIQSVAGTVATLNANAATTVVNARAVFGTDDTAAWQAAMDAAAALGGGIVDAGPSFASLCAGHLSVPASTHLLLSGRGPFDPQANPLATIVGPTFVMIQDNVTAFLTLSAAGAGVGDGVFWSANQLPPNAAAPTAFKAVIEVPAATAGIFIGRPYIPNCYIGAWIRGGRHDIVQPRFGALSRAMVIDESQDWIRIDSVMCQVFYKIIEGDASLHTGLGAWVHNNLWVLELGRVDSYKIGSVIAYKGYGCVLANDGVVGQAPRAGYGQIAMVDADLFAFPIYGVSTYALGLEVASLVATANGTGVGTAGQYPVATAPGGTILPKVYVKAWSYQGAWIAPTQVTAGSTVIVPGTNPG